MNENMDNSNSIIEADKSDWLVERFDIKNRLLGIKRDRFLLLLGHMNVENTDDKTRNV
jgi:hypothetical protein